MDNQDVIGFGTATQTLFGNENIAIVTMAVIIALMAAFNWIQYRSGIGKVADAMTSLAAVVDRQNVILTGISDALKAIRHQQEQNRELLQALQLEIARNGNRRAPT